MEPCLNSKSIPRLSISSKHESVDQYSARSDFDDLFSTTQRLEQEENVGIQIDRLNQILETVLLTINEEPSSIIKPSDLTIEEKFYSNSSTQTNFDIFSELAKKDSKIKKQESKLKSFKQTQNLTFFIQNFENLTEKFLKQGQKQYPDSGFVCFLNEVMEKCRNFNEPFQDLSFKIESPDISCISQGQNVSMEVYKRSFQQLSRQISNLTSKFVSFPGVCPEIELPEFVSSVLAEVSSVVCKEKEWELQEKRENLLNFNQKLQVACEYKEILELRERLNDILLDLEEFGSDSQYTLSIGLLNITINAYFTDEFKEKWPDSLILFEENSRKGTKTVKKTENLNETKESLQEKLKVKAEELTFCEEMWSGMHDSAQKRIEELESCIDNLMFQLDLKEKLLKLNKPNPVGLTNYLDKLQDLREKESGLKQAYEKLELERQKLVKQTIDFYCNKQISSSSQIIENSQTENLNTKDACVGCLFTLAEKSIQTETEKFEETDNLEVLTQQLNENYSILEQLPDNEKPDFVIDNIKRIKKRINDIHTNQALIFTEKSIDYAESKLRIIEKELKKGKNVGKSEEKELETYKKVNLNLEKQLTDLQNILNLGPCDSLDPEISKLLRDRISLQQKEEKFNKKRDLLKQKIDQVNYRQRKIQELEETLTEKKLQISIQSKKQECFKQAIEEEWARIDSKRQDVLKCQKMIDHEWKILLEETTAFETLKKEDEHILGHKCGTISMMEKLSQIEENALKIEIQHNQLENLKKRLEDDKNRVTEERHQLQQTKQSLDQEKQLFIKQNQELKNQLRLLNSEKIVLKENKMHLNSLVPKLKNMFKS